MTKKQTQALRAWILDGGWSSAHPLDQRRFFLFALAMARGRKPLDEWDAQEIILNAIKQLHPRMNMAYAKEIIQKKASLLVKLREFYRYVRGLAD